MKKLSHKITEAFVVNEKIKHGQYNKDGFYEIGQYGAEAYTDQDDLEDELKATENTGEWNLEALHVPQGSIVDVKKLHDNSTETIFSVKIEKVGSGKKSPWADSVKKGDIYYSNDHALFGAQTSKYLGVRYANESNINEELTVGEQINLSSNVKAQMEGNKSGSYGFDDMPKQAKSYLEACKLPIKGIIEFDAGRKPMLGTAQYNIRILSPIGDDKFKYFDVYKEGYGKFEIKTAVVVSLDNMNYGMKNIYEDRRFDQSKINDQLQYVLANGLSKKYKWETIK